MKMLETFIRERGIYYLIIALCSIGVIGKMYESILYSRLLKAAENPDRTDNTFLKQLKLKYKSHYHLNRQIHNTDAFIETSLFHYKHLESIRTFGNRLMLLCLMASCAGIAAAIYFNMEDWEIIYYVLAGTFAVTGLELLDLQCGNGTKRRFLLASLKDYLENILPYQLGGSEKPLAGTQAEELEERTKKQVAASKVPSIKEKEAPVKEPIRQPEKAGKDTSQEKVIADVIKEFFP